MPLFCIKNMNIDDYKNIIRPVVVRNNCYLWGIEILRGKKKNTLRVYIDSKNNVDINDCEVISKDLSYEPEIDINLGDDYTLEVSTPGIDRKFFELSQLTDYLGEEFEIKTKTLNNGNRKFLGKLLRCNKTCIVILETKSLAEIKFKFSDIDLCKLKPDYNNLMRDSSNGK